MFPCSFHSTTRHGNRVPANDRAVGEAARATRDPSGGPAGQRGERNRLPCPGFGSRPQAQAEPRVVVGGRAGALPELETAPAQPHRRRGPGSGAAATPGGGGREDGAGTAGERSGLSVPSALRGSVPRTPLWGGGSPALRLSGPGERLQCPFIPEPLESLCARCDSPLLPPKPFASAVRI